MELAALTFEDLAERSGIEVEGVRPEVGEVGVELLRRDEPDAGALLPPALREDELVSTGEAHAEHRRLRPLRARGEEAQAAGAHQVDAQHEVALLGREEEVLPAAARSLEATAVEHREGWRDGLE